MYPFILGYIPFFVITSILYSIPALLKNFFQQVLFDELETEAGLEIDHVKQVVINHSLAQQKHILIPLGRNLRACRCLLPFTPL